MLPQSEEPQPELSQDEDLIPYRSPDLATDILEKPKCKNRYNSRFVVSALVGSTGAIAYALMTRLIFGANLGGAGSSLLSTMSLGFLAFVPLALGAFTVWLAPRGYRASYGFSAASALLTATIFVVLTAILALEAAICLMMAYPIMAAMSVTGGLLMCWALRQAERLRMGRKSKNYLLVALLAAPYMIGPLESQVVAQETIRMVETAIPINASPQAIWRNIIRVAPISAEEYGPTISHLMGIPRPVEATLSSEGVGGVRNATFADGLFFLETITQWDEGKSLTFRIQVDPRGALRSPFTEIGGRYFEVLDAQYVLEPIGSQVILRLISHERLTTHFNAYGGAWTDFIMRDLQDGILRVIKKRVEAGK